MRESKGPAAIVGIFLDYNSILRRVGRVSADQHHKWQVTGRPA